MELDKTCCMCDEEGMSLKDLIASHPDEHVKGQCDLLIQMGEGEEAVYCPECLWK